MAVNQDSDKGGAMHRKITVFELKTLGRLHNKKRKGRSR